MPKLAFVGFLDDDKALSSPVPSMSRAVITRFSPECSPTSKISSEYLHLHANHTVILWNRPRLPTTSNCTFRNRSSSSTTPVCSGTNCCLPKSGSFPCTNHIHTIPMHLLSTLHSLPISQDHFLLNPTTSPPMTGKSLRTSPQKATTSSPLTKGSCLGTGTLDAPDLKGMT